MKVNAKLFGESGKRIAIPIEIYRMKEAILNPLGVLMHMFGITELNLNVTTTNFFPAITTKFSVVDDPKLPAILKNEQPEIMAALKILMMRFGLSGIRIEPDTAEVDRLHQYWAYVVNGAPTPESVPLKAPMPEVRDPTGQPIRINMKVPEDLAKRLPAGLGTIIGRTSDAKIDRPLLPDTPVG